MVPGWQQLLLVLVIVLILFGGRGKISSIMGDMAKGIRSFKKGLAEDDSEDERPKAGVTSSLDHQPADETGVQTKEAAKSE